MSGLPVLGRDTNIYSLGDLIEYVDGDILYKGRIIAIYHKEKFLKCIPELGTRAHIVCVPFRVVLTLLQDRHGKRY